MIESVKSLVEALRDELKNYGEMLALLDRQQEYLMTRAANEVSQSISLVQAQGLAIQEARKHREDCRRAVAESAGQPENAPFKELIPLLPADYQPLLKALVEENNELLFRVRRRARQNHLILKRSVELMQQLLNSLCPPLQPANGNSTGEPPAPVWEEQPLHAEVN
ncbi:MAG: flagellar protein FlgN [Limisphaerales bacterium]